MTKAAIIQATYADMKLVRTRSCAQLVFEIPIEQATAAIDAFGVPLPGKEVWCAIARMAPDAPPAPPPPAQAEKPAQKWANLPASQQAAMRCNEVAFRRFLDEEGHSQPCDTALDAAMAVRTICGVQSRADLDKKSESAAAWRKLDADYLVWLRVAA